MKRAFLIPESAVLAWSGSRRVLVLAAIAPAFILATAGAQPAPECPDLPETGDALSAAEVARTADWLSSPSVDLGPGCAEARRFAIDLVDRALAIGDFDRAAALCDRLAAGGTPRDARMSCARARAVVGDVPAASALMEACIRDAGDDKTTRVRALLAAARVFEDRYRFDAAAGFLGRAVAESPDDRELALRWVDVLLEAGQADQAGAAASEVASRQPDLLRELARRLVLRGATSHATGLADELGRTGGREDLDTAVSIHMGNKDPAAAKAVVKAFVEAGDPTTRLERARAGAGVLSRHGLSGDAADLFAGVLGAPGGAAAGDLELLGRLLLSADRPDRAKAALDAAFEKSGATVEAALRISDLWARSKQPRRAAAVLQRVETASTSQAVDLALRAGRHLRDARDVKAEDAWYQVAASRIVDAGALWQGVGESLTRADEISRALAAFEAAEAAAPDARRVALARIGRAEAMLTKGRAGHEAAERALRQALEGAAEDSALVARIEAAARKIPGSSALSRSVLEASLRRDPSQHDQWLLLAEVDIADQRADAVFHAYCRAIDTATDRAQVLSNAIDRLVEAGMATTAIRLLKARADGIRPTPKQAERRARICLGLGEAECAQRYVGEFLEGPLDTEYDYVSLARQLADAGMFDRAEEALSAARKRRPPSDAWVVSLERGRLDVLRGRSDQAETSFEQATAEGDPQEVAMHVARTWRAVGEMSRAATWYERAAATGDAVAVLPEMLDAYARAGRIAEVSRRIEAVQNDAWRSARRVIPVAASLVTMGLGKAARGLIEAVFESMPLSERPGLEPLRVLLALGSDSDILEQARRGCVGAQGAGGRSCELLASGLAARGLGVQALSVLDAALDGRPDAHSARVLRAEVYLRMGRVEAALATALDLAGDPVVPEEVRERLARLFSPQRRPKEASLVLETIFAQTDGAHRDALVRDSARLLLKNGEVEIAIARLEAWTTTDSHRRFTAYRLLVRAGFRSKAITFLRDLDIHAIEDVAPDLLAVVLSDLLEHGERAVVNALVTRIEGEGSPSARAVMGGALGSIGWRTRAARLLSAIPAADRSTETSLALADMLAKGGDIDGALAAMDAAAAGPDPIRPEVRETMARSLVIEGAPVERAASFAATVGGKDTDPGLAIWRATLLAAGSSASLAEARELFLREALSQAELPAPAGEYIRTEARRGSLTGLLAVLEAHPGLPARQASLHAACLLRDKKAIDRARGRIEAMDGPAGNEARLAAARAWFECGEWDKARTAAESALERMAPDSDPREAAVLAVITGRMVGKERHAGILRYLRGRTDDLLVRAEQEASVHLARGDVAAAARAMEARAALTPGDERSWVAVARLAVQAGDDALRSRAQERALSMPIDMGSALQGFEDGYRAALRDDLAGTLIDFQVGWYPADAAVADRQFSTALGAGDDGRACEAATRVLDLAGDRRAAAAFVVGQGATMLSVQVVDRFLEEVLQGGPDAGAARAVLNAAVLRFRIGDDAAGFALIERAARLATDPAGFVSSVGRAALVDPLVPPDVVGRAVAALPLGAVDPASLATLPTAFAATCLGRATAGDVEGCATQLDENGFHPVPLLIGAAKRAFPMHRYDVAEAALHAAARRDPSRIFGRMIAVEILEAVGDRHEVRDLAVRERLGAFALGRIGWRGAVAESATISLVAQLTEMASGTASARALIERDLAIHPTDASGWNGLAYLLSMAGDDLEDALRFVRKAEILEPSQNGYFLETEGWTWFRKGDAHRALDPQLQASRLWTGDLGTALAESLNHLGRILEAVGRPEEAAVAYRQAFVRGPETRHGHRALTRWRALLAAPDAD